MKKTNLIKTLTLLALLVISASCNKWSGTKLTNESQLKQFSTKITSLITPETKVTELMFMANNEHTTEVMNMALVRYIDPNDSTHQKSKFVNLTNWRVIDQEDPHSLAESGLTNNYNKTTSSITNVDYTKLPDIINRAAQKVSDAGLEYLGIERFCISLNPDPALVSYRFDLIAKKQNSSTVLKGRLRGIYCHEISFTAQANGEVSLQKIGDENWKRTGAIPRIRIRF